MNLDPDTLMARAVITLDNGEDGGTYTEDTFVKMASAHRILEQLGICYTFSTLLDDGTIVFV